MPDVKGLYRKFDVRDKATGESLPDFTFTLRPERDPLAAAALLFYADEVMAASSNTSPLLAEVEVLLKDTPNPDGEGTMYDAGVRLYNKIINEVCAG